MNDGKKELQSHIDRMANRIVGKLLNNLEIVLEDKLESQALTKLKALLKEIIYEEKRNLVSSLRFFVIKPMEVIKYGKDKE